MEFRYFEDFEPGETFALGSTTVTAEEIVAFGEQFDPQAFHTDPEAAAETDFGGLVASGWHTAALCMRQLVDELFVDTSVGPALGVEELQWRRPLYAGDELHVSAAVVDTEGWDDDRGKVTFDVVARNGDGEVVLRRRDHVLFGRRGG